MTMPLPSSGGIVLAQVFGMLGHLPESLKDAIKAGRASAEYVHLITECCKHAFADRARWLGDPQFVRVPIRTLLDPKYLAERAQKINMDATLPTAEYGLADEAPQSGGTSHLSVVDDRGGVVGGTSAGTAILGASVNDATLAISESITSKTMMTDPYDPSVHFTHNMLVFPPLARTITDMHFAERDRMGRLVGFMARQVAEDMLKDHLPLAEKHLQRWLGSREELLKS